MNQRNRISTVAVTLALGAALVLTLRSGSRTANDDTVAAESGRDTDVQGTRAASELAAVEPVPSDRESESPVGDAAVSDSAPGATNEIVAPAQDEPEDPRDERWRAKYRGMTADQLEAENERISILYTTEMSKVTWPKFKSGECSYADPTKGERPPPSKPGALVTVASMKDGRVPYVVVTEDEAPVLHEWMSELAWLLAETERLRAEESND